jgi:FlaA1/EpsC-like NDP-sugar epimerase
VIPLWKQQISQGGPVTVTHPEATRYFMLIPESVQLILQAGALGNGGEIFVLDMGKPVKIADLAHDLIRLSGLSPGTDIKVEFIGMRPGEKLYEELLTEEEGLSKTLYEKIFVGKPQPIDRAAFHDSMERLREGVTRGDGQYLRGKLDVVVGCSLSGGNGASNIGSAVTRNLVAGANSLAVNPNAPVVHPNTNAAAGTGAGSHA